MSGLHLGKRGVVVQATHPSLQVRTSEGTINVHIYNVQKLQTGLSIAGRHPAIGKRVQIMMKSGGGSQYYKGYVGYITDYNDATAIFSVTFPNGTVAAYPPSELCYLVMK